MIAIRPLDRSTPAAEAREVALVAARMRLTLEEVLGQERGQAMYDLPWLEDRVRQHLDGRLPGAVLLACVGDAIVGHTIVRAEDHAGTRIGLLSTIWVAPAARRQGVASALLDASEAWMRAQGLPEAHTCTATDNQRLRTLLAGRGYAVLLSAAEMVRLRRSLAQTRPG